MATYDNLPVYYTSYQLLVDLFKFTKELTREYKYTLGESIKKETVEMITNIYRANSDLQSRRQKIQIRQVLRAWHNRFALQNGIFSLAEWQAFLASINSYFGNLRHCRTRKLRYEFSNQIALWFGRYGFGCHRLQKIVRICIGSSFVRGCHGCIQRMQNLVFVAFLC